MSIAIAIFTPTLLVAYNPYHTTKLGKPIGWDNTKPIQYYLDPGTLPGYTNDQLHTLLQEAMKLWENVPNANVPRFEFAGYLPEDVNKDNYSKYVDVYRCFTDNMEYCKYPELHEDLKTRIIFDADNWILDNVVSPIEDASAQAGPLTYEGGFFTDIKYILQSQAVFGIEPSNTAEVVGWMAHELGHLLGLAHTSLMDQLYALPDILESPAWDMYVPTMAYGSGSTGTTLNPDDMAGISVLYPSADFSEVTSTIKGIVKTADGTQAQGVNVVARNIADPACMIYQFPSGKYCPHEGIILTATCLTPNGEYEISGLPAGDYVIDVQEIDSEYSTLMNLIYRPIAGDAEFWNEGDQASEDPYAYTIISLAAGETRENVDIILNRSEVTEDRVKFIPLDVLLANFPLPATTACTDTTIDYAALIGKDEGSDDTPTSAGCSLIIPKQTH